MLSKLFLAFWIGSFCDWYVEEDMARVEPCLTQQKRVHDTHDDEDTIP